ncbi:relA-associated inhibitor [Betta splendens]|uniref:RelA-associated inhibitor n=1 Tax=Betta splendens TaxID=158456 RepID=A0A6P7P6H4_BETSP|nr:relA-associated inhibitor [Betta splendens]
MSSQTSFSSNMLFQTINDDLNASLATADELSREFNSLFKEVASNNNSPKPAPQTSVVITRELPASPSVSGSSFTTGDTRGSSNGSSGAAPFSPGSAPFRSLDSSLSPVFPTSPLPSPMSRKETSSLLPRAGSDCFPFGPPSPRQSPHTARRHPPPHYDRSPHGSAGYMDRSPSPSFFEPQTRPAPLYAPTSSSSKLLGPYDSLQMGRRSPRPERSPSPLSFNPPGSSTGPRNVGFRPPDEGVQQRHKPASAWNETDLDVSYERKPHHTYDKSEWLRMSVPSSSWRESNLDGPLPAPIPKKDPRSQSYQFAQGSLPRNARISVPPDVPALGPPSYHPQPIISRISIPPTSSQSRQHRPIPLSVILRLQNPYWGVMQTQPSRFPGGEVDKALYQLAVPVLPPPLPQPQQQQPPELRQPAVYSDVLSPGDIDAELERLDYVGQIPVITEDPSVPEGGGEIQPPAPRPLSPTRLQPVVAPEAQAQQIPDLEELLRIRAEIPRALKRRGSVDQSQPLKKTSLSQSNHYKSLMNKLFRRSGRQSKGEPDVETSSSSDGEDGAASPVNPPAPRTSAQIPTDFRSYNSILRRSNKERKSSGNRARLSPLVLLLDGSLVGELETVQRALQEMVDPSQANDEGITALHNAVCGGHYNVVDLLVRSGASVSAADSHGWTPLHCAASCNDRALCEFLVRNGAAVMAITESDSATAAQKCDPYAVGFEECEGFLRGVEEAMGVENSGVLYALWSYPAQAPDELSFKEGDMVTILQKPEGSDWWWASLCGREGLVPSNYFGLFPKVRPKSLC